MRVPCAALGAVLVSLAIAPSDAPAQPAPRVGEGPWIAIAPIGVTLQNMGSDNLTIRDRLSGGAVQIRLGWTAATNWATHIGYTEGRLGTTDPAVDGSYRPIVLELGGHRAFPDVWASAAVPYIEGALQVVRLTSTLTVNGAQLFGDHRSIEFTGWSGALGAGVRWPLTSALSTDAALRIALGRLTRLTLDGDARQYAGAATISADLRLGVTWFPLGTGRP
ncbi:MAG TPA: hypothetical protein VHE78_08645 [Gemmatimonadaceae bacterium]|nr:hypothetical protein [Gemmatimonadaceae bacterium]